MLLLSLLLLLSRSVSLLLLHLTGCTAAAGVILPSTDCITLIFAGPFKRLKRVESVTYLSIRISTEPEIKDSNITSSTFEIFDENSGASLNLFKLLASTKRFEIDEMHVLQYFLSSDPRDYYYFLQIYRKDKS